MEDKAKVITIQGEEIILSEVDVDRVLNNKVDLKALDKFIFGIRKTYGTGLKIKHKNKKKNDYRRSNLILTSDEFIDYDIAEEYKELIGIHLDPYIDSLEYEVILAQNGKLTVDNEHLVKEAVCKLNKWKQVYSRRKEDKKSNTKEKWKNIQGYEEYQVSNTGKVRSLDYRSTSNVEELKLNTNIYGYKVVTLCKEGKPKHYSVHRLVAEAFIPNPNNYPIVNHKDENPSNNKADNLEWCTQEYNVNYGTALERRSETRKNKLS